MWRGAPELWLGPLLTVRLRQATCPPRLVAACRTHGVGQLMPAGLSLPSSRHIPRSIRNPSVSSASTRGQPPPSPPQMTAVASLLGSCYCPTSDPVPALLKPSGGWGFQPLRPHLSDSSSSHSSLHHLWSSCSLGMVGMCVPQGLCTCCSKTLFSLRILWLLPSLLPLFHCTFSMKPKL